MSDTTKLEEILDECIAVVGISLRFPQANNKIEFWNNLVNGKESIRRFSKEELARYPYNLRDMNEPNYIAAKGYLEGAEYFDTGFFNLSKREALLTDPQHRLLLEEAYHALEDAGYPMKRKGVKVGVFASSTINTYLPNILMNSSEYNPVQDAFYLWAGATNDCLATKIAYKFNLTGPAMTVQTACSSSLTAISLACESLLNYQCDMTLVGGSSLFLPPVSGYLYDESLMLSEDGYCRAFDEKASGTVFGMGIGVVVLKRLVDAISDGDRVYAVVRGTAVNNDGSDKIGYSAPSAKGQAEVIRQAMRLARVNQADVGYIETHGTGTKLGDAIEISALKHAMNQVEGKKIFLGTLKPNIGHLDAAAGIAGFIKTCLVLYNKKIPPCINIVKVNPLLEIETTPFEFSTHLIPWNSEETRIAGISSFGVGGTNVHAVLQEFDPRLAQNKKQPLASELPKHYLFTMSAKSEESYKQLANEYIKLLSDSHADAYNICAASCLTRQHMNLRYSCVVNNKDDLIQQLSAQHQVNELYPEEISLSFTEQYMDEAELNQLCSSYPLFRECYDEYSNALKNISTIDVSGEYFNYHIQNLACIAFLKKAVAQEIRFTGLGIGYLSSITASGDVTFEQSIKSIASMMQNKLSSPKDVFFAEKTESSLLSSHGELFASNVVFDGLLSTISALYNRGADINFDYVYPHKKGESFVFTELPLYPFEKTYVWPSMKKNGEDIQGKNYLGGMAQLHALLGARIPGYGDEIRFLNVLTSEQEYLKAHIVLGDVIVPGAAYIESALAAGRVINDGLPVTLRDVSFLKPLYLAPDKQYDYQVSFMPVADGYEGRIDAHDQDSSSWNEYATFHVTADIQVAYHTVDLETLKSGKTLKNISNLYTDFATAGFNYGPEFQVIREAYVGEEVALALVEVQDGLSVSGYCMHPTLLDGALQTTSLVESSHEGIFIPFLITSVVCYQPLGSRVWVEVRLMEKDERSFKADLTLYDDHGLMLAQIEGFSARVTDKRTMQKLISQPVSAEIYVEDFDAYNLPERGAGEEISVIVFASDEAHAVLGWERRYKKMIDDWSGQHVVVIYDGDLNSLVVLAQRALKEPPLSLTLILRQAFAVPDNLNVVPEQREALGFWRTFSQEAGENLLCYLIDSYPLSQVSSVLDLITQSVLIEPVVILRGDDAYVPRLYRKEEAPHLLQTKHIEDVPQPFCYKSDATYLITGGTGGLGFALAEHLIDQGVCHLVLTSRRAPSDFSINWISQQKEAGVEVIHYQADVANEQELADVFAAIKKSGYPLKGIFHTAGVVHDGMLQTLQAEDFDRVLAPKVLGSQNLDKLSQHEALDCFVLFSSLSSMLGSPSQSNYAAANAFMDGLALMRRQQGVPALAIHWGPFAKVGMAAHLTLRNKIYGLESLETTSAFQLMDEVLTDSSAEIAIMNMNWEKAYDYNNPYLSHLVTARGSQEGDWFHLLTATPAEKRGQLLTNQLKQLVAQTLSIQDATQIDNTKGFFEMGMDSLMAVELKNKLKQYLNDTVQLSNTVAFDYSDVNSLRDYLLGQLQFKEKIGIPERALNDLRPRTLPLNVRQMYLWYLGNKVGHTISFAIEFKSYDTEQIAAACKQILMNHPGLWMFFEKKYPLLNFIKIQKDWSCTVIDLSHLHNQNTEIDRLFKKYSVANPWMDRGPPMAECILIKKGDLSHILHMHISHAVFDGVSAWQFTKELQAQLNGENNAILQLEELDNQFLYDDAHAEELQQIEKQYESMVQLGWEKLPVIRTWKGRLSPKDIEVSINPDVIKRIQAVCKKLNVSYREMVCAICLISLQDMCFVKNLLLNYIVSQRDAENASRFGYIAKMKFLPVINKNNDLAERVTSFISDFRNCVPQDPIKGVQMMYSIEKEGLLYRVLFRFLRKSIFKKYSKFYYTEKAISEYAKAATLQFLSKPSIFNKKIKTTIIYNDVTFSDKDVKFGPNIEFQKMQTGTKSRKLHGRQFILAKANSEQINFIFQNWEGNEAILQNTFVKKYQDVIDNLYASVIKDDNERR